MQSFNELKRLGTIFEQSLENLGHESKTKDDTDLMKGLVAYEYLSLRGKSETLDKEVDHLQRIVYDYINNLGKMEIGHVV